MNGSNIHIAIQNIIIASSQSCTFTLTQQLREYRPIPGNVSEEEAKWKHYRRGDISWNADNDAILSDHNAHNINLVGVTAFFVISMPNAALLGDCIIKSASISAGYNNMAQLKISVEGSGALILSQQ